MIKFLAIYQASWKTQ